MAWIESHQELGAHPKTRKLARLLGCSLPAAIGHLHCLWWWALDYAQDGDIGRHDAEDVAVACLWDGDPEALMAALRACRFLDNDGQLHDWGDYVGKLIESRARTAERKAGHIRNMRQAYTDGTIHAVRNRDGDRCRYCSREVDWADRKTPRGGTYDHVIPGGPTIPENLVVACRGCNSRKGARTPEQAGLPLVPVSNEHLTTVPYPTVPNSTQQYSTEPETTPPLAAPSAAPAQSAAVADAAPAAARTRARNGGPEPMTAEQRESLLDSFAVIPDVGAVLETALAHKARLKCASEYLYARNWLRTELQRYEEHEARLSRATGRPPPQQLFVDSFETRKRRYAD